MSEVSNGRQFYTAFSPGWGAPHCQYMCLDEEECALAGSSFGTLAPQTI